MPNDSLPSKPDSTAKPVAGSRRERSTRYPGVPLDECLKICESIEELGVDGFTATDIATSLGYKSIKTNTFSARLSGSRQFGLIELKGDSYHLSPLAKEILHPVDLDHVPRLHRQGFLKPPLYAELAERFDGKKVPDPTILGNILYHNHQIIATAKQAAAEAFLDSARFCGMLGDDSIFRINGLDSQPLNGLESPSNTSTSQPARGTHPRPNLEIRQQPQPPPPPPPPPKRPRPNEAGLVLQLWDADEGKSIRLRAPRTISQASYERFLQAFRLLVKVDDSAGS